MDGVTPYSFTVANYRQILDVALAKGYEFRLFIEPPTADKVIYLRHDIDNSIECALRMARVNAEYGARATFFLLLRSENYNPLAGRSRAAVDEIVGLGHDIGLHYTGVGDADDDGALASQIAADAELLSAGIGRPVRVFSFHNPGERANFRIRVSGLINAYEDPFFVEARYLSDSNMAWRHGDPTSVLQEADGDRFQLLVHPLSYAEDLSSDRDVLLWFLFRKLIELKDFNEAENGTLRGAPIPLTDVLSYMMDKANSPS